jgi:hypothetical protein
MRSYADGEVLAAAGGAAGSAGELERTLAMISMVRGRHVAR